MLKTINQLFKSRLTKGGPGSGRHPEGGVAEQSVSIPKLKSTNDALAYGKSVANNTDKIYELQVERKRLLEETDKIKALGDKATSADLQYGLNIAVDAQFMREALESAERHRRT